MKTLSIIFIAYMLLSCEQETTVRPSNERVLYPAECDYSPIPYGSIKIYTADSQFVASIDIDYEYTPEGAYYVKLSNDTYLFEVVSDFSGKSAFITLELRPGDNSIDLVVCK